MGANDAAEMLLAAQAECVRLERALAKTTALIPTIATAAAVIDALPEDSIVVEATGMAYISTFTELDDCRTVEIDWSALDAHTIATKSSADMLFPVAIIHAPLEQEPAYREGGIGDE